MWYMMIKKISTLSIVKRKNYFVITKLNKKNCFIEKLSRRHPGLSQGPIDLALN